MGEVLLHSLSLEVWSVSVVHIDVRTPGFCNQPRFVKSVSDTGEGREDTRVTLLEDTHEEEDASADKEAKEAKSESLVLEVSILEAIAVANIASEFLVSRHEATFTVHRTNDIEDFDGDCIEELSTEGKWT